LPQSGLGRAQILEARVDVIVGLDLGSDLDCSMEVTDSLEITFAETRPTDEV
jgi:hypothetical protein